MSAGEPPRLDAPVPVAPIQDLPDGNHMLDTSSDVTDTCTLSSVMKKAKSQGAEFCLIIFQKSYKNQTIQY